MKNNDYLWDGSGEPDPEIERLESLLAPLAYKPGGEFRRRHVLPIAFALAASVVVAIGGTLWFALRQHGPSWDVVTLAGPEGRQQMSRGTTVETDAVSKVRLELPSFGQVEVEPNTRLKLLVTKTDEQRMDLAHGKIHAQIWAPPHQFYVNTPSAVTVDLGCSYTLEVNRAGDSVVRVDYGWVAFEDHGKESLIPAHAVCVTRPGKGPGIPCFEDAPAAVRDGLALYDAKGEGSAIPAVLAAARPKDAMSVWHLLRRAPKEERGAVYDRLAQLVHVPDSVSRDRAISGDQASVDALWNTLELGDIEWWRQWKR